MKFRLILIAVSFISCTSLHADEQNLILAQKLVDILNPYTPVSPETNTLLEQSIGLQVSAKTMGMKLTFAQNAKLVPLKNEYIKRMKATAEWQSTRKRLITSYSKTFTTEQLNKLIAMHTDETFVLHNKQRELISESIFNEIQLNQAKDQAWFESEVSKVILEK